MKNYKLPVLSMFILFLAVPFTARAFSVQNGNTVYVGKDQVIDGNLYAAGANITVDGRVTGDVICAGQSVMINGEVNGDVICAGQSISVAGKIGGSVRTAGSDISVRGSVDRSLMAFGANVNIEKDASIGWDAFIAAANAFVRGGLSRSLLGAGANFVIDGRIAGDATLYLNNNQKNKGSELTLADSASVGGNVTYTSKTDASISGKAQIKGRVDHKMPAKDKIRETGTNGFAIAWIIAVFSALVVGSVLINIWKQPITNITDDMLAKFWPSMGWGAVLTIITPIIAVLLAITIVGLRLSILSVGVWLILIMLSKIVAGIAIGRLLLKNFWADKKDSLITAMIVGIAISWFVFYIPVLGWFLSLLAVWWGMGGLIMYFKKNHNTSKTA